MSRRANVRFVRTTSMTPGARVLAGLVLALTVPDAETLAAQPPERSLAVGIAMPRGSLGAQRTPGPLLRGGLTYGDRQSSHVRLRLDLEAAWLRGRSTSARPAGPGTFRSVSVLASLLVGATASPTVAPYALLGLAVERLSITGTRNPYGTTFGLRTGVGARWRVRDRMMFVEVAPHLALTDFGTGMDYSPSLRVPVALGVTF